MQVTSYFEDFFKRNTVVQSDFKFDGQFKNYNFLKKLKLLACVVMREKFPTPAVVYYTKK